MRGNTRPLCTLAALRTHPSRAPTRAQVFDQNQRWPSEPLGLTWEEVPQSGVTHGQALETLPGCEAGIAGLRKELTVQACEEWSVSRNSIGGRTKRTTLFMTFSRAKWSEFKIQGLTTRHYLKTEEEKYFRPTRGLDFFGRCAGGVHDVRCA